MPQKVGLLYNITLKEFKGGERHALGTFTLTDVLLVQTR
jgi:hypothetical protein